MYRVCKKIFFHLRCSCCFRNFMSFCNLKTLPILIEIISNFNTKCRNNFKFYV